MESSVTFWFLGCTILPMIAQGTLTTSKSLPNLHELEKNVKKTCPVVAIWKNPSVTSAIRSLYSYMNNRRISDEHLIHAAAAYGLEKTTNYLMQEDVDINEQDSRGNTALHIALLASNPKAEIVSTLLFHGADINALNDQGYSPLVEAILSKVSTDVIHMLLRSGADVNYHIRYNRYTPLHVAVILHNTQTLKALLDTGVLKNINARDMEGQAALHLAAFYGYQNVVQMLLTAGADSNVLDKMGKTPLHGASVEIINVLLGWKTPTKINVPNVFGETALHAATRLKRGNEVSRLIHFGFNEVAGERLDVNARECNGITALHISVSAKTTEITKALLNTGADISITDNEGNTPLHLAVACDADATIPLLHLKDKTSVVNAKNADGATALHIACEKRPWLAEALLHVGADVNIRDNKGQTPLHRSALQKSAINVRQLLDAGANPNIRDNNGDTPFHVILRNAILPLRGDTNIACALLSSVTNGNLRNFEGDTAIDVFRKVTSVNPSRIPITTKVEGVIPRRKSI